MTEAEAEELASRFFDDDLEDEAAKGARALQLEDAWRDFVERRLAIDRGTGASKGQLNALLRGQSSIVQNLPERIGVRATEIIRAGKLRPVFRDVRTGRFVSARAVGQRIARAFRLR